MSRQELVCAAVSALTLNMSNSVERFTEDPFEAEVDEESGGFRFFFSLLHQFRIRTPYEFSGIRP